MSLDSSHLVMPELWSQASHYCMLVIQLSGLLLLPPPGPGVVGGGFCVDGGVALPLGDLLVLVSQLVLSLVPCQSYGCY